EYDFLYLGDNARAPYGNRSFDMVYEFTRQAVFYLFEQGCSLVILACNTASAKALRNIQQNDLPKTYPERRVLGILIPTVEVLGSLTTTRHVGLIGTPGTIQSGSYPIEVHKLFPDIILTGEACPLWVPLVENGEQESEGAAFFVKKNLNNLFAKDSEIDALILGCTHYPLLLPLIRRFIPKGVKIISQGEYVTESLISYLQRHPQMAERCSRNGSCCYLTTESVEKFEESASFFVKHKIKANHVRLG
ncbi:MAG: aspartate/glutamate racemase family protein, partial [Bacteroidales bacterium]|nr:aspartate/glutamate racemase family protein [Bacteroidales bacterium]